MPKLSIIIPCYFNEANIVPTTNRLMDTEKIFPESVQFEYIMVDDGSKDGTLNALLLFRAQYPKKVKVVKLSGNFGSYRAIVAGMNYATGDCMAVISADLQDPPELIKKMYDYWASGIKLVLANRIKREETFFKRMFAAWYHVLIKKYALPNLPEGSFDFCLFDKRLRDELIQIKDRNTNSLFLLIWMKFDYVSIPYTREERKIGKSRWTLKKKINLFLDSFISFSIYPIRIISVMGFIIGFLDIVYAASILYLRMKNKIQIEGWSANMMVLLLVSAFQTVSIGIMGEYLWRTYDATRNRPTYVVDEIFQE